jgi:hypothetical protein
MTAGFAFDRAKLAKVDRRQARPLFEWGMGHACLPNECCECCVFCVFSERSPSVPAYSRTRPCGGLCSVLAESRGEGKEGGEADEEDEGAGRGGWLGGGCWLVVGGQAQVAGRLPRLAWAAAGRVSAP